MANPRRINIDSDKDTLLELHCLINYESDSPWARKIPFDEYREKWLSSSQAQSYLNSLVESMADARTIAEIWEDDKTTAGYLWVVFYNISDYGITVAEVRDIAVSAGYRRRGIAKKMLARAEQMARDGGADIFRSEMGIENTASQKLHTGAGFEPFRIHYEKLFIDPIKKIFPSA